MHCVHVFVSISSTFLSTLGGYTMLERTRMSRIGPEASVNSRVQIPLEGKPELSSNGIHVFAPVAIA